MQIRATKWEQGTASRGIALTHEEVDQIIDSLADDTV